MYRILSTGTAFDIAVTTGDAGQLGMAAEFDGYFSGLISRLMGLMGGLAQGDFHGSDLFKGNALRGNRLWGDYFLGFRPSLALVGCLPKGDRADGLVFDHRFDRRYPHYFSQHSVSQH